MNADVGSWRKRRLKLIPELRRLIAEIPIAVFVAWREVALFGSRPFFVRPHTEDDARIPFCSSNCLSPLVFSAVQHVTRPSVWFMPAASASLFCPTTKFRSPFSGQAVSIFDHGGNLVTRVHMKQRKRNMAEKGLAGEPQAARSNLSPSTRA